MGNVADPRDDAVMDLCTARTYARQSFLADGVIDPNEERVLTLMEEATNVISIYRLREKAADAFVKIGVNKYVRTLFKDANAAITIFTPPLDTPSNVVAFPARTPLEAS